MNTEPRTSQWDVIVVGGGVAGTTAAISAARNGASTLLIEKDACLGGTLTTCLVGPMMTFHSATEQVIRGLPQEIVDRLIELGASPGHVLDTSGYVATVTPFDAETLKLVAERMVREAGAEILYHTLLTAATVAGPSSRGGAGRTLTATHRGTITELQAKVVIDATGDADVAARAGAPSDLGRPEDGLVQPVSLMFRVTGWDKESFTTYAIAHPDVLRLSRHGAEPYKTQPLIAVAGFSDVLREEMAAGHLGDLQREHVLFFNTHRPDEVTVNMSRVTAVNPLDAHSLTEAEVRAREQVFAIMDFLRRRIPGFRHARIAAVGSRVGVRESRRIIGDVVLTGDDIRRGRSWPDVIARSAYPIDIHAPTGRKDEALDEYGDDFVSQGTTYQIPYRALLPRDTEHLLVAGRCISTTAEAHGATRVSPTCMATGQAAGTAAALAVHAGVTPRRIDIKDLQHTLRHQGADLG